MPENCLNLNIEYSVLFYAMCARRIPYMQILILFCFTITFAFGSRKRPRDEKLVWVTEHRAVYNIGVAENGRILERYNPAIVERHYGPWLAGMLGPLVEKDVNSTLFIPNVLVPREETSILGLVRLGPSLAVSKQSVIYTVSDKPGVLIKYQANCIELEMQAQLVQKPFLHPSVVEFAFTRRASRFGLAPKVVSLSPPVGLCDRKEGKCSFDLSEGDFAACRAEPHSSLRYMIMERVRGSDLFSYKYDYTNETVPFVTGVLIGEEMMRMIEQLHTRAKIVHGDIHLGNVMIQEITEESVKMQFIDFARSFENNERPMGKLQSNFWSTHQLFSPWELAGYYPAARDDVYRVVEGVARLINPPEYTEFLDFVTRIHPQMILAWKSKKNIFLIPRTSKSHPFTPYDPVERLEIHASKRAEIRDLLEHVLSLVRGMKDDINATPPYAEIGEVFRKCRLLAASVL